MANVSLLPFLVTVGVDFLSAFATDRTPVHGFVLVTACAYATFP